MNKFIIKQAIDMLSADIEKQSEKIAKIWNDDDQEERKMRVSASISFDDKPGGMQIKTAVSFSRGKVKDETVRFFDDKQIGMF